MISAGPSDPTVELGERLRELLV
ncbi:MAG: hypothetical protein QOF38_2112, partial [Pseudonocardiales bacterium]|nr:hypothetical protein [Pseudonocardiales bacterium]